MRIVLVALMIFGVLLSASCGAPEAAPKSAPRPAPAPAPRPAPTPAAAGETTLPSAQERKIVRTADMELVVDDVIDTLNQVAQMADDLGGYVVSSSVRGEEADKRANISLRVPAEKFDEAMTSLRGLAQRVISEGTSARDITEEYIDLEARLRNLEATEKKYLELIDRAEKVEDIVKVMRELTKVRGEIEQIKGRMQYLERTSAMSLISVSLRPATVKKPLVRKGWDAPEIAKAAVRGLTSTAQGLANVGIWLLIFLPIWGPIAAVVWWWRRRRRRRRAREAGGQHQPTA